MLGSRRGRERPSEERRPPVGRVADAVGDRREKRHQGGAERVGEEPGLREPAARDRERIGNEARSGPNFSRGAFGSIDRHSARTREDRERFVRSEATEGSEDWKRHHGIADPVRRDDESPSALSSHVASLCPQPEPLGGG
jgi:hypothetical protein